MATRKQIAERILRVLQGGAVSIDSDIDIREIMLHVDSERDSLIQDKLIQSYKNIAKVAIQGQTAHTVLGNYVSEATYSTSRDSTREQEYITLTHFPVDLPDGAGVLFIKDANDLSVSYGRLASGVESMYSSLPSFTASLKTYYTMIGNRIYFSDNNPPSKVLMGLIAASSSLGDLDIYPLSPGDESVIIKSVVELYDLMSAAKKDFINDNIDE
jgi:hypothetical protein